MQSLRYKISHAILRSSALLKDYVYDSNPFLLLSLFHFNAETHLIFFIEAEM